MSCSANQEIKNVLAVTEVFPDGQKVSAVILEYNRAIRNSTLTREDFAVEGRTVKNVYANSVPETSEKGVDGRFIIVELSLADKNAGTLHVTGVGFDARMHRDPVRLAVRQQRNLTASDGKTIDASGLSIENDGERNMIVDTYTQSEFQGMKYNLFVPRNYDATKKYPLVLFIHDGGCCGNETQIALAQGLGGLIWASDSEQKKRECFVLAPQYRGPSIVNDEFEASGELETTKLVLDHIIRQYSIDTNRIYGTGQSMGCMSLCELSIRYPDCFAALLLVAGQWNPSTMTKLAHKAMWILVSEGDRKAFPGMNAVTDAMEKAGARVGRYRWNGRANKTEMAKAVSAAAADGRPVKYTVFDGKTVLPTDDVVDNYFYHPGTWQVVYTIEGLREWLFGKTRGNA